MGNPHTDRARARDAATAILQTADLLRRRFTRALEPEGLTLQQYNVLSVLAGAGGVAVPTLEIAAHLIEHTPGITRLLDRLVDKGLVSRERDETDRRVVNCFLTAAGEAVMARVAAAMAAIDDLPFDGFEADEIEAFIEMLEAVSLAVQ